MPTSSLPIEIIEETDDNFRPTGVEAEGSEDFHALEPYDPDLIRVDAKMYSLRQILDMIDEGDLELAPDFQRLRVWKPVQKSRLIESVLLRIPLPAFYFSSDQHGGLQVVDGLQRLSTIHDFVRGGKDRDSYFKLSSLEYLQDQVGGRYFKELDGVLWTRRINSTQIMANVIDPQTPYRVKFDIFRRINTGGSPLNAQEIRHCLSKPRSRKLLAQLASNEHFLSATTNTLRDSVRMVDKEVALRFCAFSRYPGLDYFHTYASMDEFLNGASQILDDLPRQEDTSITRDFTLAMQNAISIFGEHAFRKWHLGEDRTWPFNRALFDAWSVTLAQYDADIVAKRASTIADAARHLMTYDSKFTQSITSGTSDIQKVHYRFAKVRDILWEALK